MNKQDFENRSIFYVRKSIEAAIENLDTIPGIREETKRDLAMMREECLERLADVSIDITMTKADLEKCRNKSEPWEDEIRELETSLNQHRTIRKFLVDTLGMIPTG